MKNQRNNEERSLRTEVRTISTKANALIINYNDTKSLYKVEKVEFEKKEGKEIAKWGSDNKRPYKTLERIRDCEVMSQNMLFNVTVGYAGGVRLTKANGEKHKKGEAEYDFIRRNKLSSYWINQVTDMKHFYFTVTVILLSEDGKIVRIKHKDACNCRFGKAEDGKIRKIYYGDWNESNAPMEEISVLDEEDPLTDLMVRMGKEPDEKNKMEDKKIRKFAIINRFPSADSLYYPIPYYSAVFNSGWYDIKQLIQVGKKAKISNHAPIKYIVEIHEKYWERLYSEEKCVGDKEKCLQVREKELDRIEEFLTGIENAGKMFTTSYFVSPNGQETPYVRIKLLDNKTEGGDWIEDTEEASNMICYAMNIHPSLIGATPGKTKGNFSGSDKRELYTMKQSQEKPFQDIMLEPFRIISDFNEWDMEAEIPMITLTTLDKGKDAEKNKL